jgi:hypothetical protein
VPLAAMQSERDGWLSARHQQQARRPSIKERRGMEFVTLVGTDFKFTESDRIEAESVMVAPGGSSKYTLRLSGDDSDASGLRSALMQTASA